MGNCQSKSPQYNKYQEGKIYKIICNKTGKVYYGSTILTINQRLTRHCSDNISSQQVLENNDYCIELVELYPCSSRSELVLREQFYVLNNDCVNKQIPGRTHSQYRKDNKDKLVLKAYIWKQNNLMLVKTNQARWHQENKDRIHASMNVKVECPICLELKSKGNMIRHLKICKQ